VTSALDRSAFLREAKALFPALRDDLNRQYGVIHLEMHAFRDFVQGLVDRHDESGTLQAFQLAERIANTGNGDMVTALAVSFLEHLNFEDGKVTRSWARALMPSGLTRLYDATAEYRLRAPRRGAT
jgi:hypothetical protein